jgi:tetratricopeptide (TPR) repeat protein
MGGAVQKARNTWQSLAARPPRRPRDRTISPMVGVVLPLVLMATSLAAGAYALSDLWLPQGDPVETAGKLTQEGKYDQAAERLHRSIMYDPKNPRLYGLLGDVYAKQGDPRHALENYIAAAQLSPQESLYWALQGNIYQQLKDSEHAEGAFKRALRADATCSIALVGLGNIAAKRHDFKGAEDLYRKALHESANSDVLYNLAMVYQWDHLPDDAIKTFQQALILDPDHRSSMVSLAALYYEQHHYDLAAAQLIRASHLKDADLDLHLKLADCFEKIGRTPEAIHEWNVCLEQAKDDPIVIDRARRALGRLHLPPSG